MREKYESLSLAVLKDLAKARGMKGISTLRKPALIERMLEEDAKEAVKEKTEETPGNTAGENSLKEKVQEDEKMVVTTAENGKEAVDIVSQSVPGRFDFIFMDIMMPVMDGLEAARQIRTLNRKDTKEIPIIAMTANACQDDIRNCIDAGMNAHIAKPIDSKKIEDTLLLVLKQKMQ